MKEFNPDFGYQISGETMGECWIELVKAISENGEECLDEGRKRKALMDVRIRSKSQKIPDKIIRRFGNLNNLKSIIDLTFKKPVMFDFDISPSFKVGAKSYYQRIKEGKLIDFVIQRLSKIPESKKAIIVFPNYKDYESVLKNPKDDYLPCLISVQFRVKDSMLNTNAYFRSIDAFQKAHGNFEAIAMMTQKIAEGISQNIFGNKNKIKTGYLDIIIADAHIYENTLEEAREMLKKYEENLI